MTKDVEMGRMQDMARGRRFGKNAVAFLHENVIAAILSEMADLHGRFCVPSFTVADGKIVDVSYSWLNDDAANLHSVLQECFVLVSTESQAE